jgi:hypothetical protein
MTQLFPSIDNTPISGFPTEYFNRGLLADDRLRSRVAVPDTEIFADAAFLIGGNRPQQVIPGIQMDFRVAAIAVHASDQRSHFWPIVIHLIPVNIPLILLSSHPMPIFAMTLVR